MIVEVYEVIASESVVGVLRSSDPHRPRQLVGPNKCVRIIVPGSDPACVYHNNDQDLRRNGRNNYKQSHILETLMIDGT